MPWIGILFLSICLWSCGSNKPADTISTQKAKWFRIDSLNSTLICYSPFRNDSTVIVVPEGGFKRIITLNASYTGAFAILNALDRIIGIDNADYVFDAQIRASIQQAKIQVVGNSGDLQVERIVTLQPDIVLAAEFPNPSNSLEALKQANVNVLCLGDWKEIGPIAQLDWLRVFDFLSGGNGQPKHVQTQVSTYSALQDSISRLPSNPKQTVFTGSAFGDTWYIAAKESTKATLYSDSKLQLLGNSNQLGGSIGISAEEAFSLAVNADIWVVECGKAQFDAMLDQYPAFKKTKPFQTKRIYINDKSSLANGANSLWESALYFPSNLLKDFSIIAGHQKGSTQYYRPYLE